MLHETLRYLEQRRAKDPHFTFEIIVVDDGSRDCTCQVVKDVSECVRVVMSCCCDHHCICCRH